MNQIGKKHLFPSHLVRFFVPLRQIFNQNVMTSLKQEELMKGRGYRSTIRAAYNLFADNYKIILRHCWLYALVLAALSGFFILNQLRAYHLEPMSANRIIVSICMMLFALIAEIIFYGRVYMLVNTQSLSWNILRALKINLWMIFFFGIAGLVFGMAGGGIGYALWGGDIQTGTMPQANPMIALQQQMAILKIGGMVFLATLVVMLLMLPFVYPIMKYVVQTDTRFHQIWFKGWKTGMRHWGYIFLTLLLTTICLSVILLIITLPLIILMTAYNLSMQGMAQGDESGMPGYLNILAYFISVVTYFIIYIMGIFVLFVIYYIYGSIETKEQKKLER